MTWYALDIVISTLVCRSSQRFFYINVSLMITILSGGACEEQGGQCVDWRYYVCHAGVESGICPGDSNIRYIDTWSWSDC